MTAGTSHAARMTAMAQTRFANATIVGTGMMGPGIGLLHQIDVLINRIRRALVPGLILGAHLRRHRNDELILEQAAELPALAEMLEKRLAAELGQHINRINSRVDEITQHEVDDPVLASKRDGRFGPLVGKGSQPCSLAAGEDDAQYAYPHKF